MTYTYLKTAALMLSASALLVLSGCDGTAGTASNSGIGEVPVVVPPVVPPVDGNVTPPPPAEPIQAKSGITVFSQTVPVEDSDDGVFPGQANHWDLNDDGSISDGYDDQFDGAMELSVNDASFPSDQTYSELTYFDPLFGSADGVKTVALSDDNDFSSLSGTYSVMLNRVSLAQISQDVDLSTASGTVTLSFEYDAYPDYYNISGRDYNLSVVVESGGNDTEVFNIANTSGSGTENIDISAYAGQNIKLSFVYSSDSWYALIDTISIQDQNNIEFVTNGDFEGNTLTGWTANEPQETQNVTFGSRVVSDANVTVTRSFYTKPNSLWARYADVYENNTSAPVDINVSYYTNLGSDDYGIIYDTPETANKAITTWDGDNSDRDIGFVFGNASHVEYTSDDGLGNGNGSDSMNIHYRNVNIPANSKITIVNFVIMNGKDTADTAGDIDAKATEIDIAAKAIVDGMAAGTEEYYRGMTSEQKNTIVNF